MLELLRGSAGNGYTVHGFRSSFRDWAGDRTNFDKETMEHALAHQISDKTERAYRRSTALDKRRRLMEAWAGYCGGAASRRDRRQRHADRQARMKKPTGPDPAWRRALDFEAAYRVGRRCDAASSGCPD